MIFSKLFSKTPRIAIEPLRWEAGDPLAAEHELVSQLVAETLKSGWKYYNELDLSLTEAGRKILESDPEAGARLVLSLVANASHFDGLALKVKALAKSENERLNWHNTPEWEAIWMPRQVSAQAVRRLMRRKLPLGREHLIRLADWFAATDWLSDGFVPLKSFTKAVEGLGKIDPNETALRDSITRVIQLCRKGHAKELPKVAHQLETALDAATESSVEAAEEPPPKPPYEGPDPSKPEMVGSPIVLVQLKQYLGMLPEDNPTGIETIGFDHFPLRPDSPLRAEHELINILLSQLVERPEYHRPVLSQTDAGRAMLALDESGKGRLLLATAERCVNSQFVPGGGLADHRCWQSQTAINAVLLILLQLKTRLNREGLFDLLLFLSALSGYRWTANVEYLSPLIQHIEAMVAGSPLTAGERHVLHRLRYQSVRACPFGHTPAEVEKINQLLADDFFMALVPGEAWSDAINGDLGKLSRAARGNWLDLLQHAATATGSRPSVKWLKTTKAQLDKIGMAQFSAALAKWFPLVNAPRTIPLLGGGFMSRSGGSGTIHEDNATCLRGLVWMAPEVVSTDLIRAVGALTVSCYRKIPGVGPRCVKVGNAGVYALSQVNDQLAVGQLALLKVKVKFGSAQKEIEKAFNAAAERSGLPREELEEMAIPTYGLTDVGICEEPMGEFTARLTVTGTTSTELVWVKADGKIQRAVPASVKESFKDDLKELQASAKDIQTMLPAQRERIDNLFLQQKVWPLKVWHERYLNHPLIGTLARRLLWELKSGDKSATVIWFNGQLVDVDLKPVPTGDEATTVQLWHPIGKSTEEVVAWRSWLDAQQIQQPFKQAHREIYVLTDAERNTRVYSNRYAAHVLKQHQFNALCALRGWKNQLRLMVDAEYRPPTLHLPLWGLRAEFWVEGLGTEYGSDTNDNGVYLYLSADQVRFYRVEATQRTAHAGGGGYHPGHRGEDAEPLPLEEIPPLVLSEVLRDVDMFVGVASVGNDPAWSDGGPEGRYQQYWRNYSFGELNASAKTRKEVLERLVPKLKIASRCSFVDKFLVVQGSVRTYKIHLGSGNILMEPNDQYLCIVPKQGEASTEPVLLPFEGDRTLSVILSKAFMLAADSKIKDPTIISQIKR
jgi:hypothetical protein